MFELLSIGAQADPTGALIASAAATRTAIFGLIGAVVVAVVSATVTLLSLRSNRKLQSHLKEIEQQTSTELAKLEHRFAEQKSQHDAERDYEYEARKRLYKEAEPLLFRLGEAVENSLRRVMSLARTARDQNLGSDRRSWLSGPGYYMASTIYHLLVPAAVYRLLLERLTLVDLGAAPRIQLQYLLAKILYLGFTEDFTMARIAPGIPYTPFEDGWETKRKASPERYWRQGTTLGWIDVAVDALISTDGSGNGRVVSFGEFNAMFHKSIQSDDSAFGPFVDLFLYFDPRTRPVLWRILVLHAVTCRNLLLVLRSRRSHDLLFSQVPTLDDLRRALDWTNGQDSELASGAFATAQAFYCDSYPALIEHLQPTQNG